MLNKRLIRSNDEAAAGPSFNTIIWDGEVSSGSRDFSGVGFQPDLVWAKRTSSADDHHIYDSVRGVGSTKVLASNKTAAEPANAASSYGYLDDFLADGFSTVSGTANNAFFNENNQSMVAWCWKAGGDAVTNTDGTITSEVSANVDAGFSIVKYSGGSTGSTVGHGLDSAPEIMIVKRLDSTSTWSVNGSIGGLVYGTNKLALNLADALGADTNEITAATSSVFTLGGSGTTTGNDHIAYCFHSVAGFSKFGSYTGVSGGVSIDCGFEPAFVMVKCTDNAESWVIIDNKRTSPAALFPNGSDAEYNNAGFTFTFTSTGFSFPDQAIADSMLNQGGYNYIYMAFANQF